MRCSLRRTRRTQANDDESNCGEWYNEHEHGKAELVVDGGLRSIEPQPHEIANVVAGEQHPLPTFDDIPVYEYG